MDKIDIKNYIKDNIDKKTVKEICCVLEISKKSYYRHLESLGVTKDINIINQRKSFNNKKRGRDLKYDELYKISLKFRTKKEFYYGDRSAYDTAYKCGYLDEICSHMVKINFSYPQLLLKNILDVILNESGLLNDRKLITPYEIDILYPENGICVEYDGYYWHRGESKINKKDLCEKKGYILFVVNEKSKTKSYEKSIKNEVFILKPILEKLIGKKINDDDINNFNFSNKTLFDMMGLDYFRGKMLSQIRKENKKIYDIIIKYRQIICDNYNIIDDIRKQKRFDNLSEFLIHLQNCGCKTINDVTKIEKHLKRRLEKFNINKEELKKIIENGSICTTNEH